MKMEKMSRGLFLSLILIFGATSSLAVAGNETVTVTDAWVRAVPPVAANSAAYFKLTNSGEKMVELMSVTSPIARVVELHQVLHKDGLSTMKPVKSVSVPAKSEFKFEPAGYHVMLIDLQKTLKEGEKVPLRFSLKGGASFLVEADVKFSQEAEGGGHEHHHHH